MEITEQIQENEILIQVEGRIDTNTSRLVQDAVLDGFQKHVHIRLDLGEVDYISSAGLRVLLMGEKTAQAKGGSLVLTHIRPSVMEVLAMTGFAKVLHLA